jgi:hypothetical protein
MNRGLFRYVIFISLFFLILSIWDQQNLNLLKSMIVLVHEIGHASSALAMGVPVDSIHLHSNESGETQINGFLTTFSFLIIVSSGYIGTSLMSGLWLYQGFKGKYSKLTSFLTGLWILYVCLRYTAWGEEAQQAGIILGGVLSLVGLMSSSFSSIVLVGIGTFACAYSIYDLNDFYNGIQTTDAGILANYITNNTTSTITHFVGYLVAVFWSLITVWIIMTALRASFSEDESLDQIGEEIHVDNLIQDFPPIVMEEIKNQNSGKTIV